MPTKKFRSLSNSIIACLVWLFAALTIAANLTSPRVGVGVIVALVFISAVAWMLFWRPTVSIDDSGIWVQNPIRETRCDFADVQAVDGRFGLILLHHDKRFTVWAVTGRDNKVAREVFNRWQASRS
jgi:hypothetical protein